MAAASVLLMNLKRETYIQNTSAMCSHVNAGSGIDLTIRELSEIIKEIVGYKGRIVFDITKPSGIPKKLLDNSLLKNIGWKPYVTLREGLITTYEDFQNFDV